MVLSEEPYMPRCTLNDRPPIRDVRIERQPKAPQSLMVTIELAEFVAACCVNTDNSFVEFKGGGNHIRAEFQFQESRPGHLFTALVRLPSPGNYTYRMVANVLGHPVIREGNCQV